MLGLDIVDDSKVVIDLGGPEIEDFTVELRRSKFLAVPSFKACMAVFTLPSSAAWSGPCHKPERGRDCCSQNDVTARELRD